MVTTGCLIPEIFLGASKFLSINGLDESPPPTIAIDTTPTGLALLSAIVSNGTTGVTILSRCIGFGGGGALTRNITGLDKIGIGPSSEIYGHMGNPLGCLSFICFICASKFS